MKVYPGWAGEFVNTMTKFAEDVSRIVEPSVSVRVTAGELGSWLMLVALTLRDHDFDEAEVDRLLAAAVTMMRMQDSTGRNES